MTEVCSLTTKKNKKHWEINQRVKDNGPFFTFLLGILKKYILKLNTYIFITHSKEV